MLDLEVNNLFSFQRHFYKSKPPTYENYMCSFNKHVLNSYNVPITDSNKDIKMNVIWSFSLESTQSSKKR